MTNETVIGMILEEINRLKEQNPKLSLRAHARHWKISSGTLSELLNGKRPLTEKSLIWILHRLPSTTAAKHAILERYFQERLQASKQVLEEPMENEEVRVEAPMQYQLAADFR